MVFAFFFTGSVVPDYENNQELQHKHEFKLEKPEECMMILNTYFLDLGLPMYSVFKETENFSFYPPEEHLRKAYEYYKKTLQCIFYKGKNILSHGVVSIYQIMSQVDRGFLTPTLSSEFLNCYCARTTFIILIQITCRYVTMSALVTS